MDDELNDSDQADSLENVVGLDKDETELSDSLDKNII